LKANLKPASFSLSSEPLITVAFGRAPAIWKPSNPHSHIQKLWKEKTNSI
jgi:hypothetical protein